MSNRTNKYAEKAKTPEIVIDGENVVVGSAKWEAYSCKKRYFSFLWDRLRDPSAVNPLDQVDWENIWPEVYQILKEWNYVGMPNDYYSIAARDYFNDYMNGGKAYKNKIHGFGWWDPKAKEFTLDPRSVKG